MKAILFLPLLILAAGCAIRKPVEAVKSNELAAVDMPQFTPREALDATDSGTLLLDVREAEEQAVTRYDVEPQLSIPFSKLPQRMAEVPRDRTVIIACASGGRSTRAIQMLREAGFTRLINLSGGMQAWQQDGLPIVEGRNED